MSDLESQDRIQIVELYQSNRDNDDEDFNLKQKNQKQSNKIQQLRFGNHIPYFFINGEPYITIGPLTPFFYGVLILFSMFAVASIIINNQYQQNLFLYYGTIIMNFFQVLIFLMTAFRNPGIIIRKDNLSEEDILNLKAASSQEQNKNKRFYCNICNIKLHKTNRSHCRMCNICIEDHDHHCVFVGTCIGKNNIIPFYFFLVSTVVFFMFNIINLVFIFVNSVANGTGYQQQNW